jgi:lipid-binding SYLF domain-containing protein
MTDKGSSAAGPIGRYASAGTDWKMDTEMLTYSHSKGALAGLTIEGAAIRPDPESTVEFYGQDKSFREILVGDVPSPRSAAPFIEALRSFAVLKKKER